MNPYNNNKPIHEILAVYSGLIGLSFLLATLATLWDICKGRGSFITHIIVFSTTFFISVLFISSSMALFHGKNWGRLLLSILFHCIVIGNIILIAFYVRDFYNDFPPLIGGLGVFLIPAATFIAFILILHSKRIKKELDSQDKGI